MGFAKLWIPLFCLLLIVGFFLARGTLTELKEKTAELKQTQQRIETTLGDWKGIIEDEFAILTQATPQPSPKDEEPEKIEEAAFPTEAAPSFSRVLRAYEGKIGVFTPQGYLIRVLDVDLRTLPASDLAALEAGIEISSREELLERMEDFGR